jgi:hypothetical protein
MARLQARLNVARLAASRLGDYFPSVTIHINSTQAYRPGGVQGIVVDPSLRWDEAEGEVPRTASFEVRDASSPPQQGQRVYIGLGSADHRIFGGNIIKVSQAQSRFVEMPVFTVECQDNQRLLNRRQVTARFTSRQAGDIIRILISSFTSGFTATHVSSMGTVDEIEFTRETVSKAITRTLNRVGGRWYLDPYDDVHAFTGEESGVSPAPLLTSSSTVPKFWQWSHEKDTSQVRTRVYVNGFSVPFTGIGSVIASPGSLTVAVGHAAGDSGALITAPDTRIDGLLVGTTISINHGIEITTTTNNPSFQYYEVTGNFPNVWFSNSIPQSAFTVSPFPVRDIVSGDPITLVAIAQSTTLQNSIAAIEGGDGIHEYSISDGRLTQAGALQRAQAELTIFGSIEHRGSYMTRDPSAQAGRMVYMNATSPTHVSSVAARIQRVSVSKFEESSRSWNTNRTHLFPQRKVTYSSGAVRDVYQILGDFERTGG